MELELWNVPLKVIQDPIETYKSLFRSVSSGSTIQSFSLDLFIKWVMGSLHSGR